MIDGVIITPLKRFPDDRGTVMHLFKSSDPEFTGFGEVYCSTVYPGVVKGWHLQRSATINYVVVRGAIRFVLFDAREGSRTRGEIQEICLGDRNYVRVSVPPGIWNGFQGLGIDEAYVINVMELPYDPSSMERNDPCCKDIPYTWKLHHGQAT